jgi:hypothetical protein
MAKEDKRRYQREMASFYKEELALMWSGNASSSPDEGDKKPSAAETSTLPTAPSLASLLVPTDLNQSALSRLPNSLPSFNSRTTRA